MRETQERRIGPYRFRVKQLPLAPARRTLVVTTKVLGGLLGEVLQAAGAKSLGDVDSSVLGAAFAKFTANLSDTDLAFLQKAFVNEGGPGGLCAWVSTVETTDGVPVWAPLTEAAQDEVFGGTLTLLFRWLGFCLEVNFADFLSELTKVVPAAKPAPKTSE